jgi:beta-mannanase
MGKLFLRGLATVAVIGASLAVLSTTASATIQTAPAGPGVLFGAYANPTNVWNAPDRRTAVTSFESALGRPLDISHVYDGWNQSMPDWETQWNDASGRTTLISWSHSPVSPVVSGSQDAYISSVADGLKALSHPVMLEYFWEMDLHRYDKATVSPANFIAAWQHIHDIFVARGATNVEFVWCPSAYGYVNGTAQKYYPGASYVDWICADGYNWGSVKPQKSLTFGDIFKGMYAFGAPTGKPLMVGEVGTAEATPGGRAAWFTDLVATLPTMPAIKAVVYFDSLDTKNNWDWRVTQSSPSWNAFRSMAQNPYFNTTGRLIGQ